MGVFGNAEHGLTFLPIIQVDYSRIIEQGLVPILGYESKWDPSSPYWKDVKFHQATALSAETVSKLKASCTRLFDRFGLKDYGRFDFRADESGEIKLLEVNPNPGWCWDGKLAHMCELQGSEYHEMLLMVLLAAKVRVDSRIK